MEIAQNTCVHIVGLSVDKRLPTTMAHATMSHTTIVVILWAIVVGQPTTMAHRNFRVWCASIWASWVYYNSCTADPAETLQKHLTSQLHKPTCTFKEICFCLMISFLSFSRVRAFSCSVARREDMSCNCWCSALFVYCRDALSFPVAFWAARTSDNLEGDASITQILNHFTYWVFAILF